ncbi:MAG: hypothetical protein AB7O26_02395 [Planctomycetaceae bacterium]
MASVERNVSKQDSIGRLVVLGIAIVAGVVALGWVLVNIAAFGPVPTSADPGAAEVIVLEPTFAMISGEAGFNPSRRHPGPHITHWKKVDDLVRWRFYVASTGRYQLAIRYSCDTMNAGGVLAMTVAHRDYEHTVQDTGGFDKPVTTPIAEVTFAETGWHIITLRAKSISYDELLRLNGGMLTPQP